ncbi:2-iminobutanoate/2-iminopropanoate deaminase [Brevinema andersonii]|uniref:2-iminobutanoate/2-iminopropanoate deaminase n=1 Tax=Brevinema andersonii TaxID=34097 RepID=A0A1I1EPZ5_BREAD|nr:Rid family detoxifying hydrolase [Brevinema andersonii]SFB89205.1 2-iminobutanoate/2-iminopropanoate deaminase [Brevinema andersonii]
MPKKNIITGSAPQGVGSYSQAILSDNILYVSGQLPIDTLTNEMPKDIVDQVKQCMENLRAILSAAGLQFSDIVRCGVYLKNINDFSVVNDIYSLYFNEPFPARTTVEVSNLPKNALIEIDALAIKSN